MAEVASTTNQPPARDQYDSFAEQYSAIASLPLMQLESELVTKAISTALSQHPNAKVLDLGGGSGLHARTAIAKGASRVDVVDISQGMLDLGKALEANWRKEAGAGLKGTIAYVYGDATVPLDKLSGEAGAASEQLEPHTYDVVMANWVFDHSTSMQDLDAMWANVARFIKPGGIFLGVRVNSVDGPNARSGKYGVVFDRVEKIHNGWMYRVVSLTEPEPLTFDATSMRPSVEGSMEMMDKYGLEDVTTTRGEDSDVVSKDKGFWDDWFRSGPLLAVVTAKKK